MWTLAYGLIRRQSDPACRGCQMLLRGIKWNLVEAIPTLVPQPCCYPRFHNHGDGGHVGFLVDQFTNLLPVPTLPALVADRSHVFASFLNCTQSAAIFCRNRLDKLFGEILRTHGLKDRQVTKRTTKPYCRTDVYACRGGSGALTRSAPCLLKPREQSRGFLSWEPNRRTKKPHEITLAKSQQSVPFWMRDLTCEK